MKLQVAVQPMVGQVVLLEGMLAYRSKQEQKVKDLEALNDRTGLELTSIPTAETCASSNQLASE